ncbi:MAG: hydrogenase [Clostridiales bacterium]|jgi:nitrogenase molybdenum-iron protein beta chain|nr:hydrogenase [Clostridiales bacterium]
MNGIIEQQRYTCAIGAMQSVVAIPRAVPILHSGPGCGDMIGGFFERSTGYAGGSTSPCTNFGEREVVFGGTDRLRQIISNTYKVLDTDLQVVMTGCTAGIVGDDVESVVSEFRDEGRPIVSVETAGFKASNLEAHSLVVNAIIEQYTALFEDENPMRSEPNTVNLLASVPYQDPFWKGNLREYKRLLAGVGLRANTLFGPDSGGTAEWRSIPRSGFNILVSPWHGKPIADALEARYGQPCLWYPHIPVGANETEEFLNQVVDFALESGAEIDERGARAFIARERAAYYEEIDNLATFLLEFRYGLPNHANIFHDAGYVQALARFLLHEVGIVPKEQFITDGTPKKYHDKIRAEVSAHSGRRVVPIYFEPDAGKAQDILRGITHPGRGLIIGSGWDRELARERGADFLSAAAPTPYRLVMTTNYAGFSGGLRVIEDIYHNVLSTYK